MKILISDINQSHANTCSEHIASECPTCDISILIGSLASAVEYAKANGYDIISRSTTGLSNARNENEGDAAWAEEEYPCVYGSGKYGIAQYGVESYSKRIIIIHAHGSNSNIELDSTTRLDTIVACGGGSGGINTTSYGDGFEFFYNGESTQSYATAKIAGIFGQIKIEHPDWEWYHVRQALRQTASQWSTGWEKRNGFGYVDKAAATALTKSQLKSMTPTRKSVCVIPRTQNITGLFKMADSVAAGYETTVVALYDGIPARTMTPGALDVIFDSGEETSFEYDYTGKTGTKYLTFYSGLNSYVESYDIYEVVLEEFTNLRKINGGIVTPLIKKSI